MKILNYFDSLQEVPNELSLVISAYGCPLSCQECSWRGESDWKDYSPTDLKNLITKYAPYVTCVCFLGGEWSEELPEILAFCKEKNLETCLYTGLPDMRNEAILNSLTYLKTGPYIKQLGGLDSPTTNQIFKDLRTGEILNHHFQRRHVK